MKQFHICFVVSAPITVLAFLRNHISELSKHYDISVIVNLKDADKNIFQDLPLVEVIHLEICRNIDPIKDAAALWKLKKIFKKKKFDAVNSITPKAGLLAMTASKMAGIKNRIHIFTGQVWYTKKNLFRILLIYIDKFIAQNAAYILVDGLGQREFLLKNGIVNIQNSRVLGAGSISGVDVDRFKPDSAIRDRLRTKLGFGAKEVVYSFLGRMNIDKGIVELACAFDRLSQLYSDVSLLLIGFDEENMVSIVKEKIRSGKVVFLGPTSEPETILQASDIFCLPSHREGFGTSVLEASALCIPVICSNTYGLSEAVVDDVTGIKHKVGDSESLFCAMEHLYKDEDKRKKIGKAGRQYVLDRYTSREITSAWVDFYLDISNRFA